MCGRARGELAVDLYAGVGLFTLPLARRYARVIAVESDRVAARFATRNARANDCGNVEIAPVSAESWAHSMPKSVDRVVVDPPRSGLPRGLRRALNAARVPLLTYASCHPATLARDLRDLTAEYAVVRMRHCSTCSRRPAISRWWWTSSRCRRRSAPPQATTGNARR